VSILLHYRYCFVRISSVGILKLVFFLSGLARLVFCQVKSARECVNNLHGKSVMGKRINCYLDPRGKKRSSFLCARECLVHRSTYGAPDSLRCPRDLQYTYRTGNEKKVTPVFHCTGTDIGIPVPRYSHYSRDKTS
jgi:hypothetical protein